MSNKFNSFVIILVVGVITLFSMGFSVLNKDLKITGELTFRDSTDIRITNIAQKELSNATVEYADFSKKEIRLGYTSNDTNSTITYTVQITNYANVEMGILKITGLPTYASVTDYEIGTKLVDDKGRSGIGMVKTITITIKPPTDPAQSPTQSLLLEFDFQPVRKVVYAEGFSDTSSYKQEVLNGAAFEQDFGSTGPGALYILMGESVVHDYTYTNKKLTIPNVDGDISLTVLTASHLAYNNSLSGLPCSNVQCAIDEINRMIM